MLYGVCSEGARSHGLLNISASDFLGIKVLLPPLPEQRAIASILSSADAEIKALEKKLALLREQKRFLLNNLVTGTIRLPEFVAV
jgi:type I restriction enzyme S subunit